MSRLTERAKTYRLPNPSTPEDLESRWSKTLRFGVMESVPNKVLLQLVNAFSALNITGETHLKN